MKAKLAIILMGIYLFGATNACQVLKLPLLVTHFLKHTKECPGTTIAAFFKMHYIDPQPFDADYAQDMQLPFKTTPDTFCRNMPSIVEVLPCIVFRPPAREPEQQPLLNDTIPRMLIRGNIFQPPRV